MTTTHKTYPIAVVRWHDAQLLDPSGSMMNPLDFMDAEPAILELVGFLVGENKKCVILAEERDVDTLEVRRVHIIPKESIVSMKVIR